MEVSAVLIHDGGAESFNFMVRWRLLDVHAPRPGFVIQRHHWFAINQKCIGAGLEVADS